MLKALIIVSFGTANLRGINELENFEDEIKEKVNDEYYVCKAFTSNILSKMLFNKYDKLVPTLEEILFKLGEDGYEEIYINPLHIIEGNEYLRIKMAIKKYENSFLRITLGNVLMSKNEEELKETCKLIVNSMKKDLSKDDNIVLVCHGSKNTNMEIYKPLKKVFLEKGYKNLYIGTLEGKIKKEDIINQLLRNDVKNITLIPIFMLPGKHIEEDVFGEINSWKSSIMKSYIKVKSVKKSLLEYKEIRDYYINKKIFL